MPLITVTYATPHKTPVSKAAVAAEVSRLSSDILGKDPNVTAIIVSESDPAGWFCGGRSIADQKLASFWLDIHITDGTNTKDEKAAFIAEVFEAMGKLLGPLHNESYVHVHDVRADAYGFGGQTQERRYIARVLAMPAATAA
jgi:4-oxalocrotonate tautomerase